MPPSHPSRPTNFSIYDLRFDPKSRYAAAVLGHRGSNGVRVIEKPTAEDAFRDVSSDSYYSGYLQIRDVVTGALVADIEHAGGVAGFSFSPDGGSLLSVSGDGSVKIRDADSWHETASFRIDGRDMERARFSPNGEYVAVATASANDDTKTFTVRLWRLGESSQCVAVFTERKATIRYLEFTPDGEYLASADQSGIVHIHRLSSFTGH